MSTEHQDHKMITEYVVLTDPPSTETIQYSNNSYTSDVLIGLKIPKNTNVDPSKINKCKFRFSPNLNIPGVKKSALDVAKMFFEHQDRLRKGELYAKVNCYMSPRSKNNVIQNYVPYVNDIELVSVDESTKPYVERAISSVDDGGI